LARPRGDLPTVTLPSAAGRVDGRSRVGLERALTNWMPHRRWFAGKSRTIRSLSVVDSIELTDGDAGHPADLLLVSVEYAQGEPELYSVPVCVISADEADGVRNERPDLVIARVKRRDEQGPALLVDALVEPAVTVSLARMAVRPRPRRGARGEVRGASTPSLRQLVRTGKLDVSTLGGEQSNTSVLIGDRAILKLYRRLSEGVSPDLEVGRHLQGRFDSAASLLGSVEYQRRRGEPITLAVVHDFVPNEGDAWSYALDRLTGYYERVLARSEPLDPADFPTDLIGPDAEAPAVVHDLFGPFFASAELLGQRTAEMHCALAAGDDSAFAPEPFTRLYQRSLYQSILNEVRATLRAVRARRSSLPPDLEGLFDENFERRSFARLELLRSQRLNTVRTRVHGDYHLGQVLWNGRDFVIIDFEGEPDRSVGQRRLKRSPMRDVAGMVRSFDYAAQFGLRQEVELGLVPDFATATERLGPWGRLWTAWVSRRFLDGYVATAGDRPFVPDNKADRRLLLDLFLLEKVCYEVRYELDHRPDWVAIPLRSLADLVSHFPDAESTPS
jgi:maltose alpha-D-glucosyltransferase / alpha-amylase